jgi:hypothetical protein
MKIENVEVYGFQASIRAMRNPMDSWYLSDSNINPSNTIHTNNSNVENFILGDKDKTLSQKLFKAGTEHCKHLRIIQVWCDLTLPRYIYQELDTYKHLEKVSCSTMHKLMKYKLSPSMFEGNWWGDIEQSYISNMQNLIDVYSSCLDNKTKKSLKLKVKQMLPESFLQKRTINTNYQQLMNIYKQRKNHELPEWQIICNWIINLPYMKDLTGVE